MYSTLNAIEKEENVSSFLHCHFVFCHVCATSAIVTKISRKNMDFWDFLQMWQLLCCRNHVGVDTNLYLSISVIFIVA